mmetsp:Transcript_133366/g.386038  ORF Transcript_133366/g.386038 Transcript_133366/m.386038 type:complete len:325 (-) Transcript_133366:506-1480(-)
MCKSSISRRRRSKSWWSFLLFSRCSRKRCARIFSASVATPALTSSGSNSPWTMGSTSMTSMPCFCNSAFAATISSLMACNSASWAFLATFSARMRMSRSDEAAMLFLFARSKSFAAAANCSLRCALSESIFDLSSPSSSTFCSRKVSFSRMWRSNFTSSKVCIPTSLSFKSSRSSSTSTFCSLTVCNLSESCSFATAFGCAVANLACNSAFCRAIASSLSLARSNATCMCANSAPVFSTTVATAFSTATFFSPCNELSTACGSTLGKRVLCAVPVLLLPTPLWLPLPLALEASLTLSMAARFASAIAISTLSMMAGASCAPPLA